MSKKGVPPEATRWKKGQSGNPLGAKKHRPEIKRIKALTEEELIEVGTLLLRGSIEELKQIPKDPTASALKCMMAAVAVKAISKGDPQALDALLNRLIGKVKDRIVHSSDETNPVKVTFMLPSNGREVK